MSPAAQRILVLVCALFLTPNFRVLHAQEPIPSPAKFCFRARVKPACDVFALTEFDLGGLLNRPDTSRQVLTPQRSVRWKPHPVMVHSSFGLMNNLDARNAVGASILLRVERHGSLVGLKGRYRHWLSENGSAIDVGLGWVHGAKNSLYDYNTGGLTADVALTTRDWVSVFANVETLRADQTQGPLFNVGVRLNSIPGLIASGAYIQGALTYIGLDGLLK